MLIKVSTRHGHLNELHQEEIRAKAEKLLHFFSRLTMIEVTVDLSSDHQKAVEFLARAEHKHEFVSREVHSELMAATDLALDKIVHQIHRYKEKLQDHRRDKSIGEIAGAPPLDGEDAR